MRLMQLQITFDVTDDAPGQATSGPRSPTDRHPANRTPYPFLENGRTFPFSPSCTSVALTRRQFFVGYAALQFNFDQIINQWHHSIERTRIGEMVVKEGVVCAESGCGA